MEGLESAQKRYIGIKGWLRVFIVLQSVTLGLILGLSIILLPVLYFSHFDTTPDNPIPEFWLRVNQALVIAGILVVIPLVKRMSIAPLMVKIYLVVLLFRTAIDPFIATGDYADSLDWIFFVVLISYSVIWFLYFTFSERVKATYLE